MKKRIIAVFITCLLLCTILVPAQGVDLVLERESWYIYVAGGQYYNLSECNYEYNGKPFDFTYPNNATVFECSDTFIQSGDGTAVSKLKSTNRKVVSIEKIDYCTVAMTLHRTGKALVSFKQSGLYREHHYNIYKYTNPVKSLKIGGKQYASKFKRRPIYRPGVESLKGKITVKAAKGWKLTGIRRSDGKIIKNGGKLNISLKKNRYVSLTFKHKTADKIISVKIDLNPQ